MKNRKLLALLLSGALTLTAAGCGAPKARDTAEETVSAPAATPEVSAPGAAPAVTPEPSAPGAVPVPTPEVFAPPSPSRTTEAVNIVLADSGILVDGKAASADSGEAVYVGAEIIYYHDGTDASYGEGTGSEKHSAAEAAGHTVVTITRPGVYRLTGTLSRGQISIDLGKSSKDDPEAVVTLILDNANVTCTVAPALIFYNVYECDREFVAYDNDQNPSFKATANVDTTAAGANVILAAGSVNNFTGSHVARIYKEGTTKKLHKYDAAFYSKRTMNIFGDGGDDSGCLNIVADNEGLDSELHLTINGGKITIKSQDDGVNTNEDFVSVTTINGGTLMVDGGNGAEGDGIDSNGYLVINGGTIFTTAHPGADGGIDADSPIQINGGTLYAFGGRNDAADSSSAQPYMELSFASRLTKGTVIELKDEAGTLLWSAELTRECQSVTLTTPELRLNTTYHLYVNGVLQCWNGNSFGMMGGHGGMNGFDRFEGQQFQMPDGQPPQMPDGQPPQMPDGQQPPQGFDPSQKGQRPDRGEQAGDFKPMDRPNGFDPGEFDRGGKGGFGGMNGGAADGSGSVDFVLTETVKSFSGVCDSDAAGKTRVTFAVEGPAFAGGRTVIQAITAITPSESGLDPSDVQITVTDDPSEDYAASCLLSDGLAAVNCLLPDEAGNYTLTVAVVAGNSAYTGAAQISFTVAED